MRTKGEGAQAASMAIASYQHQAAELQAERTAVEADIHAIQEELRAALAEVGALLLPSASAVDLASAAAESGFVSLAERHAYYEQQRGVWAQRLAEIEAIPSFRQREQMLHPEHGTLLREAAQCDQAMATLYGELQRFDAVEDFVWVQHRELQKTVDDGALSTFLRAMTFAEMRENNARDRCVAQLGYPDWNTLMFEYNARKSRRQQFADRKSALAQQREQLQALIEEHATLHYWVHHFEQAIVELLRRELADHVIRHDLRWLHGRVRPEARVAVARCHALTAKLRYLEHTRDYLARQTDDRMKRVASIDRVRSTWQRKPWAPLYGDKSKWLVTLPQMKQRGTQKRLRWTRTMRSNVYYYDDYDHYDSYLYAGDFLAWDAFAYGAEERMPYEGFTRSVIPELDGYRQEYGQEKADYALFKAVGEGRLHAGKEEDEGDAEAEDDAAAIAGATLIDEAAELGDVS